MNAKCFVCRLRYDKVLIVSLLVLSWKFQVLSCCFNSIPNSQLKTHNFKNNRNLGRGATTVFVVGSLRQALRSVVSFKSSRDVFS